MSRPVDKYVGSDLSVDLDPPELEKFYRSELLEMDNSMPLSIVSAQIENSSGTDTKVFTCMEVVRRKFIKGNYRRFAPHQFLNVGQAMLAPGNSCDIRITIEARKKNMPQHYKAFKEEVLQYLNSCAGCDRTLDEQEDNQLENFRKSGSFVARRRSGRLP